MVKATGIRDESWGLILRAAAAERRHSHFSLGLAGFHQKALQSSKAKHIYTTSGFSRVSNCPKIYQQYTKIYIQIYSNMSKIYLGPGAPRGRAGRGGPAAAWYFVYLGISWIYLLENFPRRVDGMLVAGPAAGGFLPTSVCI